MQRHNNFDPLHDVEFPIDARALVVGHDRVLRESYVGRLDASTTPATARQEIPSDVGLLSPATRADVIVWDLGPETPSVHPGALEGVNVPVVALVADGAEAAPLLAAGVAAVLPRTVSSVALNSAVETVRHGLTVVDPTLLPLAGNTPLGADDQIDSTPDLLTPREQQVLELLARGISNKAIATDLGVSGHTAKFHIASIMYKLDADTRTEAVVTALRRGLLRL